MTDAKYEKIKSGMMISNGDYFGHVVMAAANTVLVSWGNIPPVYYPADVWDCQFGSDYVIVDEATSAIDNRDEADLSEWGHPSRRGI